MVSDDAIGLSEMISDRVEPFDLENVANGGLVNAGTDVVDEYEMFDRDNDVVNSRGIEDMFATE